MLQLLASLQQWVGYAFPSCIYHQHHHHVLLQLPPPLSTQMLQHNLKFPLFFPSCISYRFLCVRRQKRKVKVMRDCFFFSLLGSFFVIFLVCLFPGRVRTLYCYSACWRLLFNSTDSCTDSEKNNNGLFLWIKSLWYVNWIKAGNQ